MLRELNEYRAKAEFAKDSTNPLTAAEFDYLFKNREFNGFSKAFVKINRRKFLVHVPTFVECLANRLGR